MNVPKWITAAEFKVARQRLKMSQTKFGAALGLTAHQVKSREAGFIVVSGGEIERLLQLEALQAED